MKIGHDAEVQRILEKADRKIPVRDASRNETLRFVVTTQHVKRADPKSVMSCALNVTLRDIMNSDIPAIIFHTVCYVPIDTNGDGKADVIRRYVPDTKTRHAIEDFDKTGKFAPGEYTLNPPAKSNRLNSKQKRQQAKRDATQKLSGVRSGKGKSKKSGQFLGVRNGTGMVHFFLNKSANASSE